MIKSVILSMQPSQCCLVANDKKIIDIRKTRPKLSTPFKCYIYCTNAHPYVVNGDVFRGNWETEFTTLYGYNRKEAEQIWNTVLNGKIIGEFICDKIDTFNVFDNGNVQFWNYLNLDKSGFTYEEISNYIGANKKGYAWHISNVNIYEVPKDLNMFYHDCGDNPICEGCKLYYTESNESIGFYEQCSSALEGYKNIEHPPHSWCYAVEE